MRDRNAVDIVLIILAVIGAIAVLGVLGVWLMAATMMGGAMSGCCGIWGGGGWFIGLLILAGVVATAVLFIRRKPRP
jgi:hypothetical protein